MTFLAGPRLTSEDTNNSFDVYLVDRQSGERGVASATVHEDHGAIRLTGMT